MFGMFLLARISNSLIRACFCLPSSRGIGGDDAVMPLGRRNWSLQIGCCWAGIHSSGIDVQSAAAAVRLIKQAMEVRLGPPQAVMFRLPCGKGNETQNPSNGIVRETCTHHQAVLKSVMHQKQVIADSSGQAATVWDARRSTCLIFGQRVQPTV
jgi:hypothetical protein